MTTIEIGTVSGFDLPSTESYPDRIRWVVLGTSHARAVHCEADASIFSMLAAVAYHHIRHSLDNERFYYCAGKKGAYTDRSSMDEQKCDCKKFVVTEGVV